MAIYLKRPQSLGEGLRRVVKAAGDGKAGVLQRYGKDYGAIMPCSPPHVRRYTNGVEIAYAKLNSHPAHKKSLLSVTHEGIKKASCSTEMDRYLKFFEKLSGWFDGTKKYIYSPLDINNNPVKDIYQKGRNFNLEA